MKTLFGFFQKIYMYRSTIKAMALRDVKVRYVGTMGGLLWSVINPLMIVLVYWFVFSIGFRVRFEKNIPFIIVFMAGFIPWTMFSEVLLSSINSIRSNTHL
ncbi:ABC transporter permease, partial [bacterium]